MSNHSESVEIVGSNPGSTAKPDAKRSGALNPSKMPVRNGLTGKSASYADQLSGRPQTVPSDAENSGSDADRDGPSRQTSEAQDESGQV